MEKTLHAHADEGPAKKRFHAEDDANDHQTRFNPEERHVMALMPLMFMSKSARNKWIRHPEERQDIEIDQPGVNTYDKEQSPVNAARDWLMSSTTAGYSFAQRQRSSVRAGIMKWFYRRYPFDDLPRVDPDLHLRDVDWDFLLHALTEIKYDDGIGNQRHHESLHHFKQSREFIINSANPKDVESTAVSNAKQQVGRLEDLMEFTDRTLETLDKRVKARFADQIEQREEHFKDTRTKADSFVAARRLLGHAPMVEAYHSKKLPKLVDSEKAGHKTYQPDVQYVYKYKKQNDKDGKVDWLKWDEAAWHLTGCLDGFSVHLAGAVNYGAKKVWCKVRSTRQPCTLPSLSLKHLTQRMLS